MILNGEFVPEKNKNRLCVYKNLTPLSLENHLRTADLLTKRELYR